MTRPPRGSRALLIALLILLSGGSLSLAAQTLAEDVVKAKDLTGIEFRNYVGPHKVIETRLAIQGIGADLGQQMKGPGATGADYGGKYKIVRLNDPTLETLSADLLILGPDAGVDHIRNLNWIVSAYLQLAFGYSPADGDLLANFITRYNAFYRGRFAELKDLYIPPVAAAVSPETFGLSTLWSDWPGKTRMVIPLRNSLSKGLAGSVNTEAISNKDITTQMAQEPGQGLEDRKKLANLKEAEIVQEQKAIAQAEAKAPVTPGTSSPGPSTAPPADTAPAKTAAATAPAAPAPAASPAPATSPATTPAAAAPAAAATTAPAAAIPLEQAKKDVAARDQALQAERKDIVAQETKQPAPATPAPAAVTKPALTVPFVRMNETTKAGQLWLIDPAANKVWKKSELNSIRQPEVLTVATGFVAVAGDTKGANSAVRLVLLSKEDASLVATGADDVNAEVTPVAAGSQILTLVKADKSGWVLGLFDAQLKLSVKGTDLLSSLTGIVPVTGGVLVQTAAGAIILLDAATLKKKSGTEG